MDINSILSQLKVGGSKDVVYISVTPGVGLEMIQLDIMSKTVNNYSYRPLEYKEALREIADMDKFKEAVLELFEEMKLSPKCDVMLNLPMVLLGKKELPVLLGDEAVTEALTSEVEQSYIFKRYDPEISWIDVSNTNQSNEMRKFIYSALQKNVITAITEVFNEIGSTVISIEVSLISVLKALAFSGAASEQMKEGVTWNLMLVTQNGYSLCSMVGKNIVDYYEEPLAIKSFENDEIYNAINASAQITLMSYPANYLYVISETDLVSAEVLAAKLKTEGTVNYFENNDFKKDDIIPVSLNVISEKAHKISLEIIGLATGNWANLPVVFNFVDSDELMKNNPNEVINVQLGKYEFTTTPNIAKNISILVAIAVIIPMLILAALFPMLVKSKQSKLNEINSKYNEVQSEVSSFENQDSKNANFNVNTEIKKVLTSNRAKLMGYSALGESIPSSVWLTYFVAQDDGKFDIKGESSSVEDIYAFFKNMKDSLINTKLRLHKLEMKEETIEEAVTSDMSDYQFEITNMDNPDADKEVKEEEDTTQKQPAKKRPKLQLKNKPLLSPITEEN